MKINWDNQTAEIIDVAKLEAMEMGHKLYGPEHVILAFLSSGNTVPNKILRSFAIDYLTVKKQLKAMTGQGEKKADAKIRLSPSLLKVFEQLVEQELVTAEHLLKTILKAKGVSVIELLSFLHITIEELEQKINQVDLESLESDEKSEKVDVAENENSYWLSPLPSAEEIPKTKTSNPVKSNKSISDYFSSDVQIVIESAKAFADQEGAKVVATEHLVLGILSGGECIAKQSLTRFGINVDEFSKNVKNSTTEPPNKPNNQFSVQCMSVLSLAFNEARALRKITIEREHLLLGIIGEKFSTACVTMENNKIDLPKLRSTILESMGNKLLIEFNKAQEPLLLGKPEKLKANVHKDNLLFRGVSFGLEKIFDNAAIEAVAVGDSFVNSVHLLLSIVEVSKDRSFEIFSSLGIEAESIRMVLAKSDDSRAIRSSTVPKSWQISLEIDEETSRIIYRAYTIAEQMGSPQVQPVHVVHAMANDETCKAFDVLVKQNVDLKTLNRLLEV